MLSPKVFGLVDLTAFGTEHKEKRLMILFLSSCQLIFSNEYTQAENQNWHLKHFCCFDCDNILAGEIYVMINDKPVCKPCYVKNHAVVRTIGTSLPVLLLQYLPLLTSPKSGKQKAILLQRKHVTARQGVESRQFKTYVSTDCQHFSMSHWTCGFTTHYVDCLIINPRFKKPVVEGQA